MAVNAAGRSISRGVFFVSFLLIFACSAGNASVPSPKKSDPIQGAADRALSDYIARVRQQSEAEPHAMGSIWSEDGAFTRLTADVRAMHAHDLISIVVVEALSASTDGSATSGRPRVPVAPGLVGSRSARSSWPANWTPTPVSLGRVGATAS